MSRDTAAWKDDKNCVQLPLANLTSAVLPIVYDTIVLALHCTYATPFLLPPACIT